MGPQLHQRELSLPTSFPSVKPYQRQDNMFRLAALFLLVSAWCLTSEAGPFGLNCADWKGVRNDDWKAMMRCFDDVRSYVRRHSFAFFMCRRMRDECKNKMSDEAENSVSAENEPATAMEDAGNAAAMEDWNGYSCSVWKGLEHCLAENKTKKGKDNCWTMNFQCGF